ncbi:hypothetical protein HDV04_003111 [Boothiomyces sp. JEL0838]|nr:hypothetical protein HDV04_004360 [Boothiomyces sp. JEL0838]KAJ3312511.1 hypothetical protein HDV04_003111 [Boothiomyces sp. JEL0838]
MSLKADQKKKLIMDKYHIERIRRDKMKTLIKELKVLVPKSKSVNIQQVQVLANAVNYIKTIQDVLKMNGLLESDEQDGPCVKRSDSDSETGSVYSKSESIRIDNLLC